RSSLPAVDSGSITALLGMLFLVAQAILLFQRRRTATDPTDVRRTRLVFISVLPGLFTWFLRLVLEGGAASPRARAAGEDLQWLGAFAGTGILVYAIVRHRLFDIRFLVRKSLQYALAKGTLVAALALPGAGLLVYVYEHRNESLANLLTERPALYVGFLVPLALALRYRKPLLD